MIFLLGILTALVVKYLSIYHNTWISGILKYGQFQGQNQMPLILLCDLQIMICNIFLFLPGLDETKVLPVLYGIVLGCPCVLALIEYSFLSDVEKDDSYLALRYRAEQKEKGTQEIILRIAFFAVFITGTLLHSFT